MDKEYEILADRLIKALKGQNEEQLTLKLISGEVVSSNTGYTKAMIKISSGVEIQAINKSKEQLKAGESVWIGYIKSLADAVVLFKAGVSAVRGVGEDLGNGNERFNDYVNNLIEGGGYNSERGQSNTIINSTLNDVSGTGNRVVGNSNYNSVSGENNKVFAGAVRNAVQGNTNLVMGSNNLCLGYKCVVGSLPYVSLDRAFAMYDSDYKDSNNERNGNPPGYMSSAGNGSLCAGEENICQTRSVCGGQNNIAISYSTACGMNCVADNNSIAQGIECIAYNGSIAIGKAVVVGTQTNVMRVHDMPPYPLIYNEIEFKNSGENAIGVGDDICVAGDNSAAFGRHLYIIDDQCLVCGRSNIAEHGSGADQDRLFVVGDGTQEASDQRSDISPKTDPGRSDCFEVYGGGTGVFAKGAYNTIGADYAEYFEWFDGNPDNEDRVAIFVTLEGDKIRPAGIDDDYILGVVSATPSIIGNSDISAWNGKYKRDIFGRLMLDAEDKPIISEDYSNDKQYIPRGQRKEYAAVGMLGQLIVLDDGSCKVNGYCEPSKNGIATATYSMAGYRVIKRLDESHIKIIFR